MTGVRDMLGGISGFKGRLLLFPGMVVLAGMAWTGGRQLTAGPRMVQMGIPAALTAPGGSLPGGPLLAKADRWRAGAVSLGITFMLSMVAASVLRAAVKTWLMLLVVGAAAAWFLESQGDTRVRDQYFETVQTGGNWLVTRLDGLARLARDHLATSGVGLAGFGLGLKR
jgi:hypothetical protein